MAARIAQSDARRNHRGKYGTSEEHASDDDFRAAGAESGDQLRIGVCGQVAYGTFVEYLLNSSGIVVKLNGERTELTWGDIQELELVPKA